MKKRMITWLLTLCAVLCLLPFGVNAASKLSTPDVTAKNVASSGKIQLSWDKVKGAETYRIYRATSKNGTYKKIKTTSKTSYTDTSAAAGKQYYYKVKAVEEDGDTSKYSAVDTRVCDLPQPDVTVTNTASTGKVKLSWKAIDGAEKYVVYRATSKTGEYKKVKTTTATAYTDSSAKVGKTYYYQVVAVHAKSSANSAKSTVIKRTRDLPRPDVTVKLNGSNQPKVSWKTIEGAENYIVYRSTAKNGEYTKLKTTAKTAYTDKTAEAGTTYYYKVKAVHEKSAANSAFSSVDKIQVPKASDSGNNGGEDGNHQHTYEVNERTEPTCEEYGSMSTICSVCGELGIAEGIPPTGHSWGDWVSANGTDTRTCSECGKTETRETPANKCEANGWNHTLSAADKAKITRGNDFYKIVCECGHANFGSNRDEALDKLNAHAAEKQYNYCGNILRETNGHYHNVDYITSTCAVCNQTVEFKVGVCNGDNCIYG